MSDQQLNPDGPPAKKMNRAEKKADRHRERIQAFQFQNESQCRSGYVAASDRVATDCCFGIVFLLVIVAMIGLSAYGFAKGNAALLLAPTDPDGHICGDPADEKLKAHPNIYFTNLDADNILDTAVCVAECPAEKGDPIACVTTKKVPACGNALYGSEDVLYFCVPTDKEEIADTFKQKYEKLINSEKNGQFFQDIQKAWKPIVCSFGIGLVYVIIFMYLMAYCAPLISYLSIAVIELALLASMGSLVYGATQHPNNANGFYIGAAVTALFFLLFNCLMCCYWNKVQVAIAVIDATADFMVATKRLAFVSMFYFFVTILYLMFWGVAALGVVSLNEIKGTTDGDKEIIWSSQNMGMMCFMFFGLIWLMVFIAAKVQFITMSSAAQYYFSSNRENTGSASICSASYQASLKHMGSLALGSLIHTLIIILKMIIEAASNDAADSDNAGAKIIFCLLKCCVSCIEEFVEYLNTLAYAMMAISGDSYCTSAWNGFMLNLKHCVKFYFATNLASAFVFIGMVCVVAANMGTAFALIQYAFPESKGVSTVWSPLIAVGVFTFFIAVVFLGPFDEAVTATLMCLAVDLELNGEPKHGPPSYHEKLDAIFDDEHPHAKVAAHDPEININGGYNG